MKTQEATTTDLADFCSRERAMLVDIFMAWDNDGLPDDFSQEEVRPMFNRNSGNVFLTNSEFQVCMMNGDKLESWYNCFNCGHEGFIEDCQINDCGCQECHPMEKKNG